MGKPVFLLDRYDHCWRWLSGRSDSPWYPRMRIFRQPKIGAWESVLQNAAEALRAWPAGDPVRVDLLKVPEAIESDA